MALALIAGDGDLPRIVYDALGGTPYVASLEGYPPKAIAPHETFRVERLGSFIAGLAARGVTEVCFAGAIRRPPLDPSKVDARTMPLVPRMMAALQAGDDAALRIVLDFFEEAGLAVRAAQDIAPDLLAEPGILTTRAPSDENRKDIARARDVVTAMGAADLGQACIVCKGQALAVEATMGTDWMINSVALFRGTGLSAGSQDARIATGEPRDTHPEMSIPDAMRLPEPLRHGGILFKAPKPGQDRRIDLPVIGVQTLRAAAAAGLDGVAVAAGGVMILDRASVVAEADALGLFLMAEAF